MKDAIPLRKFQRFVFKCVVLMGLQSGKGLHGKFCYI